MDREEPPFILDGSGGYLEANGAIVVHGLLHALVPVLQRDSIAAPTGGAVEKLAAAPNAADAALVTVEPGSRQAGPNEEKAGAAPQASQAQGPSGLQNERSIS